ncbi:hypothetical protein [Piscirickettsia salmonis]|uniref:hypothetical protein n=1 Tax=Piscirickettsia salmonis TaxID=1238 RepID=UPI0012BADF72|nr:hypothetical protein [Piscirickettsia salmonis]QGP58353.1 Ankyrin repeats (3 copies) [Piscirickettsia salmonis]
MVQLFFNKPTNQAIYDEILRRGVGKKGIGYIQWNRTSHAHMTDIAKSLTATIDAVTGLPQIRVPYELKNTLLGNAVAKNNLEWAEKALKMGANPNTPYFIFLKFYGEPSPFQIAIKDKNKAMISLLLQYGANPHDQIDANFYKIFRRDFTLLNYAKNHRDDHFFEFLTKEIDKHQIYQTAIALEILKFHEPDIPSPANHLIASFLSGQETVELSRELSHKLIEYKEIKKLLWARLCQETAHCSNNSMWIHTSNPDKAAALHYYGRHEPDSMLIRNFIGTAAQRRRHGAGETFCLETVCRCEPWSAKHGVSRPR